MIAVSEELRNIYNDASITLILQILPAEFWLRVSDIAKIRIENKLIQSISAGKKYPDSDGVVSGALGTWASDIAKHFTMKSQLAIVLEEKLKSTDNFSRNYAAVYFLRTLPQLENPWLTNLTMLN